MTQEVAIYALDVGTLRNIGWWRSWRSESHGGADLDALAQGIAADIDRGRRVALGFECPMFVPTPSSTSGILRQRVGEAGRPWCAGAGAVTTAIGVQQVAYTLAAVAARAERTIAAGFSPTAFQRGQLDLLIWEAFVSNRAKDRSVAEPHLADALAAVKEFSRRLGEGNISSDIGDADVLNLAAAALIRVGISDDLTLLSEPCVVVRAPDLGA